MWVVVSRIARIGRSEAIHSPEECINTVEIDDAGSGDPCAVFFMAAGSLRSQTQRMLAGDTVRTVA